MRWSIVSSAAVMVALVQLPLGAQNAPAAPAAAPAVATITLPAELDRVLREYERHWRARDMPALAALFTEDGFITSRTGWVRGHAGIQARYQGMAGGDLRLAAVSYSVNGTVGYIVGTYGYGDGAHNGKFVLALKRISNGPWRIAADIDQ